VFKSLGNIASLLKQAQQMKSRMSELQEKLAQIRVEGTSGGGLVQVEVNGQQKVTAVRVDEKLLNADDREMLEDLLVAACNQALDKAKEEAATQMSELTGGMDMPQLDDVLGQLNPDDSPTDPPASSE
jgi:DNA-binding YbaB/EbfC family protein